MAGEFGRDVKLKAQLTHIGDPQRSHRRAADGDLPALTEPKISIANVIPADPLNQFARMRADDINDGQ